jgi:hypothetical protein
VATERITKEELAELARLEDGAIEGPWTIEAWGGQVQSIGPFVLDYSPLNPERISLRHAALVVALRNAAPKLLATITEQAATIERQTSNANEFERIATHRLASLIEADAERTALRAEVQRLTAERDAMHNEARAWKATALDMERNRDEAQAEVQRLRSGIERATADLQHSSGCPCFYDAPEAQCWCEMSDLKALLTTPEQAP